MKVKGDSEKLVPNFGGVTAQETVLTKSPLSPKMHEPVIHSL